MTLASHLADAHGIDVAGMDRLDDGVWRVQRRDGPDWVARWFPEARSVEAVAGDAAILAWLGEQRYPAERPAVAEPVTTHEGRAVLVTGWVAGTDRGDRRAAVMGAGGYRTLGGLLGRLQDLDGGPDATDRPGGAWHHFADGPPTAEVSAALAATPARHRDLRAALEAADDGAGLPEALAHPDFVLANVVATPGSADEAPELVVVDWSGTGRAARIWPVAWLLYASFLRGPLALDRALAGYREVVDLTSEERDRLPGMLGTRALVLEAWGASRRRPSVTAKRTAEILEAARAAAGRLEGRLERARPRPHGAPTPSTGVRPFSVTLAQALIALTMEIDNVFEERMPHRTTRHGRTARTAKGKAAKGQATKGQTPWLVSVSVWATCLRHVPDAGITAAELGRRARVRPPAMKLILTRVSGWWGYLAIDDDTKVITLTPAGGRACGIWAELPELVEGRWRDRFGPEAIDRLRRALVDLVTVVDLPFPDHLSMERRGPPFGDPQPEAPDERPLMTLLAQALSVFTLEVNVEAPVPLTRAANVLRVLDHEARAIRDLPAASGLPRNAIYGQLTGLERDGFVETSSVDRRRLARLTDQGLDARAGTAEVVGAVERRWDERFGPDIMDPLREVLAAIVGDGTPDAPVWAGLEPAPGGWRSEVAPVGTLPHHPLVNHRGGWPDGA